MSQILWMISFISDSVIIWIINIIIIIGLSTVIASNLPIGKLYKFPLQVIGIITLVGGVYVKGYMSENASWLAKMADLQHQVEVATKLSTEQTAKIETKTVTKIQYIRDTQYKTKLVIKNIATKIDAQCTVKQDAIYVLNSAAKGELPVLGRKSK